MTFLAVLGWLTAGLIAWGSSTASTQVRSIPWKWFAFFCFFLSLDETLDLARMVTVDLWPSQIDGLLRLAAYAYLLEFSRRTAVRFGWTKISPVFPVALPVAAQIVAFLAPNASPTPEIAVAFVAGFSGAGILIAAISRETRPLLAISAALALLGPSEILRSQGGVAIDGLYGLLVTGEGFASALTAGVLAWVAALSLWLYNVLRRRFGFFAGRPEASSPVAAFVLPVVLAATLAAGYFVVNWSSQNVRTNVEHDYLSRARTAALSVDADLLRNAERDVLGGDVRSRAVEKVRSQIQAISDVGDDIRRVDWRLYGRIHTVLARLHQLSDLGPRHGTGQIRQCPTSLKRDGCRFVNVVQQKDAFAQTRDFKLVVTIRKTGGITADEDVEPVSFSMYRTTETAFRFVKSDAAETAEYQILINADQDCSATIFSLPGLSYSAG